MSNFTYRTRFRKEAIKPSRAFPLRNSVLRPRVLVRLIKGREEFDLLALIDSGADHCLFDAAVAESMNIDVKAGPEDFTRGIGDQIQSVYFHDVEMEINKKRWSAKVGFTYNLGAGALLGREGFFDTFTVNFDQSRGFITIEC